MENGEDEQLVEDDVVKGTTVTKQSKPKHHRNRR